MSDGATHSTREGEDRPVAVIDVHAHLVPKSLVGADRTVAVGEHATPPATGALVEIGERLRAMDAQGVQVQVVSPWIELAPRAMTQRVGIDHVRRVNDAMADAVSEAPDRLVPMALLPQADGEAAAKELERAVVELGMCGALVLTNGPQYPIEHPALEPMWEVAAHRRALILAHPFSPVEGDRASRAGVGNPVGTPLESTLAAAALLHSGVLERHESLRVCIVHGGGSLPMLVGRMEALWDLDAPAPGLRRPGDLAGRLFYDTLTFDEQALQWLSDRFGPDRLLLGSDFPFPTGEARPVLRLRSALGDQAVAVTASTAARLLGEVDHGAPLTALDNP